MCRSMINNYYYYVNLFLRLPKLAKEFGLVVVLKLSVYGLREIYIQLRE